MNKPEDKPLKIVFAPAFFENFEGDQAELDSLVQEITSMFEGKTAEEIEAMSKPVNFDDLSDEELEVLSNALDDSNPNRRKLQ